MGSNERVDCQQAVVSSSRHWDGISESNRVYTEHKHNKIKSKNPHWRMFRECVILFVLYRTILKLSPDVSSTV